MSNQTDCLLTQDVSSLSFDVHRASVLMDDLLSRWFSDSAEAFEQDKMKQFALSYDYERIAAHVSTISIILADLRDKIDSINQ